MFQCSFWSISCKFTVQKGTNFTIQFEYYLTPQGKFQISS